jgi:hypothetical protein
MISSATTNNLEAHGTYSRRCGSEGTGSIKLIRGEKVSSDEGNLSFNRFNYRNSTLSMEYIWDTCGGGKEVFLSFFFSFFQPREGNCKRH